MNEQSNVDRRLFIRRAASLAAVAALMMAAPATGSASANAAILDSPLERQVFQRSAEESAEVKVAGTAPADATLVEAKAGLGAGLRGKAVDWTVVAHGGQIKEGRFSGSLKLETGGWYTLNVRFRKSADDATALAEATVEKVGVGDGFVTAGQSNSVNYGNPRQKSAETLSVYFDGKRFTPADQYEREAKAMIEFSRQQLGWPVDWFVAGTCYCPPQGKTDWKEGMASVLKAQKTLWDKGIAHRGPDTNDLVGSPDYRHDGIHFGPRGLLVHAERWYTILSAHYGWASPVTQAAK